MQTLVPTALMDVEEISDSESLEEITAEDFTRGSCKSRVSMPDLINSPSPRNSLPVSSDFAWEEEAVVIEDSSEEEAEEGEIEEGDTYLLSIEDNSEEAVSEMEMKEEAVVIEDSSEEEAEEGEIEEGDTDLVSMEDNSEEAASEMKDAIIDLGLETQVAVEITTIANCESELKESVMPSVMPFGEFDRLVRLIREELESVNTDEAAASFESRCGRVRESFDSLKQIYRESWDPIPNSLDQSIVIPGTKKEEAGDFLLRTLNSIKNKHSYLLTTEQSQENTQTEVGGIHEKPFYPPQISYSEAKTNGNQNKERSETVRGQEGHTHKNGLSSHPAQQPDIAQLVTDKLKDIASTMSSLQSTITSLATTQNISQPIPNRMNEKAVMLVTDDSDGQTVSGWPGEQGALGVPQKPNPWGDVNHLLDGYDDQQVVSIQRERARRIDEQNKMFAARKLSLVLDLDHTLLNSAKFTDIDPTFAEKLRKKEEIDRGKPKRHLFRFQHMGLWTKLRPGIWNFLERASKLFELHIYTMGNKMYATEIAKVLDPTGTLFAGRVISRGDDNPVDGFQMVPKSKDLDGVLGMESGVVIIDDSLKVWPYNKQNLIVVERYTYFPCSRRQFGLSGPSLLEIDHDERVKDGTLASSLSVIERAHVKFFSHCNLNDADVRNILSSEQRKILKGCRIVFSRIFPVEEANPHLHPLWQTAEQFGAVCTNQIDEQVTHVVANLRGTDKVTWALSTGRFVVQPGWVEASALLYRRAKEHEFVVKP